MQGARRISLAEFNKALTLLAGEKQVSLEEVQQAVAACPGPSMAGGTTAGSVRLHDDKSTHTGACCRQRCLLGMPLAVPAGCRMCRRLCCLPEAAAQRLHLVQPLRYCLPEHASWKCSSKGGSQDEALSQCLAELAAECRLTCTRRIHHQATLMRPSISALLTCGWLCAQPHLLYPTMTSADLEERSLLQAASSNAFRTPARAAA